MNNTRNSTMLILSRTALGILFPLLIACESSYRSVEDVRNTESVDVSYKFIAVDSLGNATVEIGVRNTSDYVLEDITLEQTYNDSDVTLSNLMSESMLFRIGDNGKQLLWRHIILNLKPQEFAKISHKISMKRKIPMPRLSISNDDAAIGFMEPEISRELLLTSEYLDELLGEPVYFAALMGADLEFESGDHDLSVIQVDVDDWVLNTRPVEKGLRWTTRVTLSDKNGDDDFYWEINTGIGGLRGAYVFNGPRIDEGRSGGSGPTGNITYSGDFHQSEELKDYDAATVVLTGWKLGFSGEDSDHEIKKMGFRLIHVTFEKETGKVHWVVKPTLADNSSERRQFFWAYSWTVVAVKNGVTNHDYWTGHGNPSEGDQYKISRIDRYGPKNAIVLPRGWRFAYRGDEDHEIGKFRYSLINMGYDWNTGRVGFRIAMEMADEGYDDYYDWKFHTTVLGFDVGGFTTESTGRQYSSGGSGSKDHTIHAETDIWD